MSTDKIIQGIKDSPLTEKVKKASIEIINESSNHLDRMFESLQYQAPSAHKGRNQYITEYAMSLIAPTMREAEVSEKDGTNTYAHIYASISGEDPTKYLE